MAVNAVGTAAFKFKEVEDQSIPKTVRAAQTAEMMMINYIDGEGHEQNRLAAVFPGQKGGVQAFLFNEKISGSWVATKAYDWLNAGLTDLLDQNKEDGGIGSV